MADVKVIQIAEVNPKDGKEIIRTKTRVPLNLPDSTETLSVSKMKSILENAHERCLWSTAKFFYKDDNNEIIRILDTEAPWPVPATGDGELFAWYSLPVDSEDESENEDENNDFIVVCPGPSSHMPGKKKIETLTHEQVEGYGLLHAAGDGCLQCVQFWITHGVSVNFQSTTQAYNAMDFILWAQKKQTVSKRAAQSVIHFLHQNGAVITQSVMR